VARLSTHVLDTAAGKPAAGIRVELFRLDPRTPVASALTNADGRTDQPLLSGALIPAGVYELVFAAGDYLRARGVAEPLFLDEIIVRFGVFDGGGNYHVPLLLSPFGYTTYRGS
jgi:5-hydroxyisourate hydrolase